MKQIHLYSGITVLVIFAITGQYMNNTLDLSNSEFNAQRMMYRASHIYLLLAGVTNTLLGCYWTKINGKISSQIQVVASISIALSQLFLLLAFYIEPPIIDQNRLYTLAGCLCLLVGTVLTLITVSVDRKFSAKTKN